jgi:hypothetical protein
VKEMAGYIPDPSFHDIPASVKMPCLCGRDVRYRPGKDTIPTAVRRHNATPEHEHWQANHSRIWYAERQP